jgi:hypothetical protein
MTYLRDVGYRTKKKDHADIVTKPPKRPRLREICCGQCQEAVKPFLKFERPLRRTHKMAFKSCPKEMCE